MFHKFINLWVGQHINVSSSGHYTAQVTYTQIDKAGKIDRTWSRYFMLESGGFLSNGPRTFDIQLPVYLLDETRRILLSHNDNGVLKFYEYDRDKNKRYDNLRYHDIENWDWIVKHMRERVK